MELFWFFPKFGDDRYLGTPLGARAIAVGVSTPDDAAKLIDARGDRRYGVTPVPAPGMAPAS